MIEFGPSGTIFHGSGLFTIFIGITGDIGSFATCITTSGRLITAGAFFTGILKFHGRKYEIIVCGL